MSVRMCDEGLFAEQEGAQVEHVRVHGPQICTNRVMAVSMMCHGFAGWSAFPRSRSFHRLMDPF